jgi:hypothetical protein
MLDEVVVVELLVGERDRHQTWRYLSILRFVQVIDHQTAEVKRSNTRRGEDDVGEVVGSFLAAGGVRWLAADAVRCEFVRLHYIIAVAIMAR